MNGKNSTLLLCYRLAFLIALPKSIIPITTIEQISKNVEVSCFAIFHHTKRTSMHPILKNILSVVGGIILGGIVNSSLIWVGHILVPAPEGYDESSMEAMTNTFHLLETKHLIFPIIAHGLGTLVGAFIAARFAYSRKLILALFIGLFFLLGGAYMISLLPSPLWFNVLDLALAYFPMAFLGYKIAEVGFKFK